MTENEPPAKRRFFLTLCEAVGLVALISFLIALLIPAVDAARDIKGEPPVYPFLVPFYKHHPWLFMIAVPILSVSVFTCILLGIRAVLPPRIRGYFPWTAPRIARPKPEPIEDSRPAVASAAIAVSATALLVFAASHVRADRSARRPVVTWVGPAADYVEYLAYLGWGLSVVAIAACVYTHWRFSSKWNWLATLAGGLAGVNFFWSLVFLCAVYED